MERGEVRKVCQSGKVRTWGTARAATLRGCWVPRALAGEPRLVMRGWNGNRKDVMRVRRVGMKVEDMLGLGGWRRQGLEGEGSWRMDHKREHAGMGSYRRGAGGGAAGS